MAEPDISYDLVSLIQVFQNNAIISNLKELIIAASPSYSVSWDEIVRWVSASSRWADLEAVLSHGSALERVFVFISPHPYMVVDDLHLQTQLSLKLPLLTERGMFSARSEDFWDMRTKVWSEY